MGEHGASWKDQNGVPKKREFGLPQDSEHGAPRDDEKNRQGKGEGGGGEHRLNGGCWRPFYH